MARENLPGNTVPVPGRGKALADWRIFGMSGNFSSLEVQGELGAAALPGRGNFGKIPGAGAAGLGDRGDSSFPGGAGMRDVRDARRCAGCCSRERAGAAAALPAPERHGNGCVTRRFHVWNRAGFGRWEPSRESCRGARLCRPDGARSPRRARCCSGLGWLRTGEGARANGIIPAVAIPNSAVFPLPASVALPPALPSPALLPGLSRSKVNPAPGVSAAPPAPLEREGGGSSDPAGSAPGRAGGAGGSRGLPWSIPVPRPGLFQGG